MKKMILTTTILLKGFLMCSRRNTLYILVGMYKQRLHCMINNIIESMINLSAFRIDFTSKSINN